MIKTIAISIGTLAGIGVLAYTTRKWWMPLVANLRKKKEGMPIFEPSTTVEKEIIDKLSYEYIIKCVEHALSNKETDVPTDSAIQLMVMPNKVAQDYCTFIKTQGYSFFIEEELTEEEKEKMIVILVATVDTKVIWGRVFIPDELSDDFYDFIPNDKIYTKAIKINRKTGIASHYQEILQACESPVWVVEEKFTIATTLVDYIANIMEDPSEYDIQAVYITPIKPLFQFIEERTQEEVVIYDDDLQQIEHRLQDAIQNGEVLLLCKVKDSQEQEHIVYPRFVKAEQGFEQKIQDALDFDKIYEKRVSMK